MALTVPEGMEPIAGAPKDGTRITVWRDNVGLYSVQWLDGAWCVRPGKPVPDVTHWEPVVVQEPEPEPEPGAPRSTAMWRARAIMKLTPLGSGEGTLLDAVMVAIGAMTDPVERAAAEEALERGNVFDRDGVFVPMLASAIGIGDEQLEALMIQAESLPA